MDPLKRPHIEYDRKEGLPGAVTKPELPLDEYVLTKDRVLQELDAMFSELTAAAGLIDRDLEGTAVKVSSGAISDALGELAGRNGDVISYTAYITGLTTGTQTGSTVAQAYRRFNSSVWGNASVILADVLRLISTEGRQMQAHLADHDEDEQTLLLMLCWIEDAKIAIKCVVEAIQTAVADQSIREEFDSYTTGDLTGAQVFMERLVTEQLQRAELALGTLRTMFATEYAQSFYGAMADSQAVALTSKSGGVFGELVDALSQREQRESRSAITDITERGASFGEQMPEIVRAVAVAKFAQSVNREIAASGGIANIEVGDVYGVDPDTELDAAIREAHLGGADPSLTTAYEAAYDLAFLETQYAALADFEALQNLIFWRDTVEMDGGNLRAGTVEAGALKIGDRPAILNLVWGQNQTTPDVDGPVDLYHLSHSAGDFSTQVEGELKTFTITADEVPLAGDEGYPTEQGKIYWIYAKLIDTTAQILAFDGPQDLSDDLAKLGVWDCTGSLGRLMTSYGTSLINGGEIITDTLIARIGQFTGFIKVGDAAADVNAGTTLIEGGKITVNGAPLPEGLTAAAEAAAAAAEAASVADAAADAAQQDADTANGLLADIAADSKLTPVEKQAIRREWEELVAEHVQLDAQADAYGEITAINTAQDNLNTAYDALGTYLNNGGSWDIGNAVPSWIADAGLAVTTDIVAQTFRDKWSDYYTKRQILYKTISDQAKALADAAATAANAKPTVSYGPTAPANPKQYDIWIDTTDGHNLTKVYDGADWVSSVDVLMPGTTTINGGLIETGTVVGDVFIAGTEIIGPIVTAGVFQTAKPDNDNPNPKRIEIGTTAASNRIGIWSGHTLESLGGMLDGLDGSTRADGLPAVVLAGPTLVASYAETATELDAVFPGSPNNLDPLSSSVRTRVVTIDDDAKLTAITFRAAGSVGNVHGVTVYLLDGSGTAIFHSDKVVLNVAGTTDYVVTINEIPIRAGTYTLQIIPSSTFDNGYFTRDTAQIAGSTTGTTSNTRYYKIEGKVASASGTPGKFYANAGGKLEAEGDLNITGEVTVKGVSACVASATGVATWNNAERVAISSDALPADWLQIGRLVKVTIFGTCTASSGTTITARLRLGAAGTASDAEIANSTWTSAAAGSSTPWRINMYFMVKTVGSGGTGTARLETINSYSADGILPQVQRFANMTMSSFNTTTANQILSATVASGGTGCSLAIQQAWIELI